MAKLSQEDILVAIDGMTVLELSEFIKAFEERYGVTAAAPAAVAVAAAPDAGAAAVEEQTEFEAVLTETGVTVASEVKCTGQTGVEMEALTAVSVALLTVYDMCKAVDKQMRICGIYLIEKTKTAVE